MAGLSMRDLGSGVGMRAQSLYIYFPSKHAIYDAMFAEANQEILDRVSAIPLADDPLNLLRRYTHVYLQFCNENAVRYQLLYQRTIPKFEPSAESYALASKGLEIIRRCLRSCGATSSRAFDAWTAIIGGLAAQQNANEPGGNRWLRLADEITDMYLSHYAQPD
ncbi:MAG: TetR/AcrR family transcriptional regulator [Jatrophihabitantaceae bacterium]